MTEIAWAYLLLGVQFALSAFVIFKTIRLGKKWLAWSCAGSLLLSEGSYLFCVFTHRDLTHPWFMQGLFIFSNSLLLVCAIVLLSSSSTRVWTKIAAIISILGGVFYSTVLVWFSLEFGEETLFSKNLYGRFYLNYYRESEQGLQYVRLELENPLYIERKISVDLDGWEVADDARFISFQDSILKFSVSQKGKDTTMAVDTRFDWVNQEINGIRIVHRNNQTGAIDEKGNSLIPLGQFEMLGDNYNGYLLAMKNGKAGWVDKNGHTLIPFKFDGGGNFISDSTSAKLGENYYWINKKGEITSVYGR